MIAREATVVIRPRSTRESLDLTFPFLIRVGGRRYLGLAALVLAPAFALTFPVVAWLGLNEKARWLVAVPIGVWLQGVFTFAAAELLFSDRLSPAAVLRAFARRLVPYTFGLLCSRLLLLVAAATVVLWPWAWSRLLFVPEVQLLEGVGLSAAVRRAALLGEGRRTGMLELLCWLGGVACFGVLAAQTLGHGILQFVLQVPEPRTSSSASFYALLGWYASVPLTATLRFLRYIDGRTRSDGWDAQIKLQQMAQAGRSPDEKVDPR